jgi:hypothetical protein
LDLVHARHQAPIKPPSIVAKIKKLATQRQSRAGVLLVTEGAIPLAFPQFLELTVEKDSAFAEIPPQLTIVLQIEESARSTFQIRTLQGSRDF